MNLIIAQIIGWIGVILYLFAYLFLSIGKLRADHMLYHFLNILGALGLVVNACFLKDQPNLIVNLVWIAIAIYSIFKLRKTGKA